MALQEPGHVNASLLKKHLPDWAMDEHSILVWTDRTILLPGRYPNPRSQLVSALSRERNSSDSGNGDCNVPSIAQAGKLQKDVILVEAGFLEERHLTRFPSS